MNYAIQTQGLSKVYGAGDNRVEALRSVDLTVQPGELFAIMGPSGSGKSTLLLTLGLVTKPTEGRLVLGGEDIYGGGRFDLQRMRRERIGFIFQSANLLPFLTAKENVMLPLTVAGVRTRQAAKRAQELLEQVGLDHRGDHLPDALSGGEKQRVAITRGLANNPKIILADEPTASLDAERGLSVMRLLRQLASEHGTAILVVTHDTRMINEVDRVIHMIDGRGWSTKPGPAPVVAGGPRGGHEGAARGNF